MPRNHSPDILPLSPDLPVPQGFVYGLAGWQRFAGALTANTPPDTGIEIYQHGTEVGFTLHGVTGWEYQFHMLRGEARMASATTPAVREGRGHGITAFIATCAAFAELGEHPDVTFTAEMQGRAVWGFWGAPLDYKPRDGDSNDYLFRHLTGYAQRSGLVPHDVKTQIAERCAAKDRHILPWLIHDSGLGAVPFSNRNLATDMIVTAPGQGWDGRIVLDGEQNDLQRIVKIYRRVAAEKGWPQHVTWQPPVRACG